MYLLALFIIFAMTCFSEKKLIFTRRCTCVFMHAQLAKIKKIGRYLTCMYVVLLSTGMFVANFSSAVL